MSELKNYPYGEFLSGTLAAWAIVIYPLIAILTGAVLAAFAVEGLRGFAWLLRVEFYFAAGILLPASMLFTAFGAVFLLILVSATFTFWLRETRRAEALLAICLTTLLYGCYVGGSSVYDEVSFCIRALIAVSIPIGLYLWLSRLPLIRARRLLEQLAEERQDDDDGWITVPPPPFPSNPRRDDDE